MKWKERVLQTFFFFAGIIFFKSELKNLSFRYRIERNFYSTFKRWAEIKFMILLTWIRIYQILWIRIHIQSMRIHITAYIIHVLSIQFEVSIPASTSWGGRGESQYRRRRRWCRRWRLLPKHRPLNPFSLTSKVK